MKLSEYKLKTNDNLEIHVFEWLPDNEETIKGIVQISHGMAEHAARYGHFASFLTKKGFAVFANDHRGHGKTAGDIANVGNFGNGNGWDNVVSDMKILSHHAVAKFEGKPFFIMGHSMGSFLTRKYILEPGVKLRGAILSGTAGNPGLTGQIGVFVTKFLMMFYPKNSPSKLMDKLSFGAYNSAFKPNRTAFDWLSRDNEQVDKYVKDPFCGYVFSLGGFNQLLKGLLFCSQQKNINKTSQDLPILMFSGEKDPVGNNGKGVNQVYKKFKKAGIKDVNLKLFANARHETLNETNRSEVYEFVFNWLKRYI